MKIRWNFHGRLYNDGGREIGIRAPLDMRKLASAAGPEIDDLPFRVNAGIRATARGGDLHRMVEKRGKGLFEGFLDRRLAGLALKSEKRGAVVFQYQFDVSHIVAGSAGKISIWLFHTLR
jgi:hypothetical protein